MRRAWRRALNERMDESHYSWRRRERQGAPELFIALHEHLHRLLAHLCRLMMLIRLRAQVPPASGFMAVASVSAWPMAGRIAGGSIGMPSQGTRFRLPCELRL
jgi:DNA-binding GntR family transcriptional regulator